MNRAGEPPGGPVVLLVVRRDQERLHAYLRGRFADVAGVQVVLDRRRAERRQAAVAVAAERRRGERRQPVPPAEAERWLGLGYRLARAQDAPALRAPGAGGAFREGVAVG